MTRYCTVLLLVSGAAASWPLAWPTNTELSEWTHPEPTPGSNFDGDKNVDPESKYAARWFAHGRYETHDCLKRLPSGCVAHK